MTDERPLPTGGDPEPEAEPETEVAEDEARRYPSTIGGACYLFALAVIAVGLAVVVLEDWRVGVRVMAGALLFASVCRFVLPSKDAGMLEVRNRWVDGLVLAAFGGALIFLASSIPNQPPL